MSLKWLRESKAKWQKALHDAETDHAFWDRKLATLNNLQSTKYSIARRARILRARANRAAAAGRIMRARAKVDARNRQLNALKRPTKTSKTGVKFIAEFEGWFPEPYNDPAGYATVGFGHLIGYRAVTQADRDKWGRLTEREGWDLLAADLREYESAVRRIVRVPITQGQFDALVSFAYNLGPGTLGDLESDINARRWADVASAMKQYVHAGGAVLPGLVRRRNDEAAMFMKGL